MPAGIKCAVHHNLARNEVSLVGGVYEVHHVWHRGAALCEGLGRRVSGPGQDHHSPQS